MVTTSEPERPGPVDAGHRRPGPAAVGNAGQQNLSWPFVRLAGQHWRRLVAGCCTAAGVALFAAYLLESRTLAATSNGAGQVLQAWDMLHGNLLLHGWSLSDVSFYTTELPEYLLVEGVRGLDGNTMHIAAALSYVLVVLLAGWLTKGRATGRDGAVRMLIAAGILLAPPRYWGTYLMLAGPDHLGTQVPLLLIWLLLDRAPARWWVPVCTGLLLTWAQVADPLVLVEGACPIVAVSALRAYRRRGPLAGHWHDLSMIAAAIASAEAAKLALTAIRQAGGFYVYHPVIGFSSSNALVVQFFGKVESVLQVFGADFLGLPFRQDAIIALVHLTGLVLVGWALVIAVRRLYIEDDLLVQLLTVGFVLMLGAFFVGIKADSNEIVGLPVMGAVLAGRLLPARLGRLGLLPALAAVLACYLVFLGAAAATPAAPTGRKAVIALLRSQHLSYGLGGFWNANSITVETGGRIAVRPAKGFRGRVVLTPLESSRAWYDPRRHDARFVLLPDHCDTACLTFADIAHTFGKPDMDLRAAHFEVLVYRHNLLSQLRTLYWCGNVWAWNTQLPASRAPCR